MTAGDWHWLWRWHGNLGEWTPRHKLLLKTIIKNHCWETTKSTIPASPNSRRQSQSPYKTFPSPTVNAIDLSTMQSSADNDIDHRDVIHPAAASAGDNSHPVLHCVPLSFFKDICTMVPQERHLYNFSIFFEHGRIMRGYLSTTSTRHFFTERTFINLTTTLCGLSRLLL